MPDITAEDWIAIHETIALHGHLVDDREWNRLGEVFADDVVFDMIDYGYGTLRGLQAVQDLVRGGIPDDANRPLAHHLTNIVIDRRDHRNVWVRSKGLAIAPDGTVTSGEYKDILQRRPTGWRIIYRKVGRRTHIE